MKYEEALKINDEYRESWCIAKYKDKPLSEEYEEYIDEKITYHNIVHEALEMQIPKKPNKGGYVVSGDCPNCGDLVTADMKYCKYCGQLLDWTE